MNVRAGTSSFEKTLPEMIGWFNETPLPNRQKFLPMRRERAGGSNQQAAIHETVQRGENRENIQKPNLAGKNHPAKPMRDPINWTNSLPIHTTQGRSVLTIQEIVLATASTNRGYFQQLIRRSQGLPAAVFELLATAAGASIVATYLG